MSSFSSSSSSSPFDNRCLDDKVALVTGGGSGIGYEISRQLLLHGCRGVIICGRRQQFLQQAVERLKHEVVVADDAAADGVRRRRDVKVLYSVCDVRDYDQCSAVVELCRRQFGILDVLVNGAAGNFLARASELKSKGFRTVVDIDAIGTFNMSRAAYSLLSSSSTTGLDNNDRDPVVRSAEQKLNHES